MCNLLIQVVWHNLLNYLPSAILKHFMKLNITLQFHPKLYS